jgi:hypothetical protein
VKWFCIILLLLNVAYCSWELNRQLRQPPVKSAPPNHAVLDGESLKLLRELDVFPDRRSSTDIGGSASSDIGNEHHAESIPATSSEAGGSVEEPAQIGLSDTAGDQGSASADFLADVDKVQGRSEHVKDSQVCFTIGPLSSEEEVIRLRGALVRREAWFRQRKQDLPEKKRFWVYLAPMESQELVREKLSDLSDKGVTDYMLIRQGEMKNAISLGIYNSEKWANRRLDDLVRRGFNPVVMPQHQMRPVYWLDVQLTRAADVDGLQTGVEVAPAACEGFAMLNAKP